MPAGMEHMPYRHLPDSTGLAAVATPNHGSGTTRQSPAEGSTSVTDEPDEQTARTSVPLPRPVSLLFASVFVVAMLYSLVTDGDPKVIIGLGAFALLALGVDLGSLIGRK